MNPLRLLMNRWQRRRDEAEARSLLELKARYHAFRVFLENNGRALELIVALDGILAHGEDDDLGSLSAELLDVTGQLVDGLNLLSGDSYPHLYGTHGTLSESVRTRLEATSLLPPDLPLCVPLDELDATAPRYAGNKAANLGLLRRMGLPAPDGFVCTVQACRQFIESGRLAEIIRRELGDIRIGRSTMTEGSRRIRSMILTEPLSPQFLDQLRRNYVRLTDGDENRAVSMRSSGAAEDRAEHTFAGQFSSELNLIGFDAVCQAWRQVVASGFSPRAMTYRQHAGMDEDDFHLAVLCQLMVRPQSAGVLMTRDPAAPRSGRMLLSAVPGLGTQAVGGSAPADLFRPWRSDSGQVGADPHDGAVISRKTEREVPDAGGGVRVEAVPEHEQNLPLLSREQLTTLTRMAEMIESLHGMPQDIEWAVDHQGDVALLQARPLRVAPGSGAPVAPAARPLLTGLCACPGKAVGRTLIAHTPLELAESMRSLSEDEAGGRILVLPQGFVDAARYLPRVAGAVVDAGNPTDHLSCVAREYGTPMLTGSGTAVSTLASEQWIVLDADNAQVLEAPPELWSITPPRPLRRMHAPVADGDKRTPREELRNLITPLTLTDTESQAFRHARCSTLHDLVRYAHEMAVLDMFQAGDQVMDEAGTLLSPLHIGVPFHFLVIDVGGGLSQRARSRSLFGQLGPRPILGMDDIISHPLRALCDGLTTPGLSWHVAPQGGAVGSLMSRNMLDKASSRPAGSFNYALVARDYLNLNSRVEFHFAMLDAVCGDGAQTNHIRFRLKGGGTSRDRTSRRARLVGTILTEGGFTVTVHDDLVTAVLAGAGSNTIRNRLIMLGRLMGYIRCLDAVIDSDETADRLARAFLNGIYDVEEALEA